MCLASWALESGSKCSLSSRCKLTQTGSPDSDHSHADLWHRDRVSPGLHFQRCEAPLDQLELRRVWSFDLSRGLQCPVGRLRGPCKVCQGLDPQRAAHSGFLLRPVAQGPSWRFSRLKELRMLLTVTDDSLQAPCSTRSHIDKSDTGQASAAHLSCPH